MECRLDQHVVINAPLETVWAFSMDLTKIPTFHPRVVKVDLLSGKAQREPGVAYQCHLKGGKHTCIKKDIEIVPMEKIVTVLPEDTFAISKILSDYVRPRVLPSAHFVCGCTATAKYFQRKVLNFTFRFVSNASFRAWRSVAKPVTGTLRKQGTSRVRTQFPQLHLANLSTINSALVLR